VVPRLLVGTAPTINAVVILAADKRRVRCRDSRRFSDIDEFVSIRWTLPFRYHSNEPVESTLTAALIGLPFIAAVTGIMGVLGCLFGRSILEKDKDGSVTIWFGPTAPSGHEKNWVQTSPGKGYNVLLRLFGPLEPWFDKTWRPGDLEVQP
jgi:hypothetical protein